MIIYTWNMQGCTNQGEARWTSQVMTLINGNASALPPVSAGDVVLLQECGKPSANVLMNDVQQEMWAGVPPPAGTSTSYGTWNVSTSSREKWVYMFYAYWGQRCNLAIISATAPTRLIVTPNPVNGDLRPMIGALINNVWFFTLHCISPGGADATAFIPLCAPIAGRLGWFCGGDFNRPPLNPSLNGAPATSWVPNNIHCWDTGFPTHPSSRAELDYAVCPLVRPTPRPIVLSDPKSDHLPVQFTM